MAGGNNLDLESLRMIFADTKTHISIAKIKQLSVASDRSFLKCLVSIFPEQREVVARMTWAMTGPESGIVEFPEVDDLVLVAFAQGDPDYCFIISRMTSSEDKFPLKATEGHLVLKAKSGKQLWITSNNKILLSKGDGTPAENLVLGQKLKTLLSTLLEKVSTLSDKVSSHTHVGNLGYPTDAPIQAGDFTSLKSDFDALKANPVDNSAMLSDIAFTEKGS